MYIRKLSHNIVNNQRIFTLGMIYVSITYAIFFFSRFSSLMPIVQLEDAARQILNAIRREDYIITVPYRTLWFLTVAR